MGRTSHNQKVFNLVWEHFVIKQGKQSIIEDEWSEELVWAYRGPYRRRDPVGLLILDDNYSKKMEGLTVEELLEAYPDLQLGTKDVSLLSKLQWAHDCAVNSDKEFNERVRARLEQVAQEFKLEMSK